jgi:MFS family permease
VSDPNVGRGERVSAAEAPSPSARERIYRRNFVFFLADNILYNVAAGIIGSNTVIPDFVRHLTSSEILIGLFGGLVAIGQSLPQLFIARYIVRYASKKPWFVIPNVPVRVVMLIFSGIMLWLGKDQPQLILLVFFICYSIATFGDGLVGVPWSDMTGTSMDNRWRARMFGFTIAGTGLTMLLVAPLIGLVLSDRGPAFPGNYAALFAASGVIFVFAIFPGLFIRELPGGKAVEKIPPLSEFLPDLGRMLRDDLPFRAYIVTRMFTSLFMMAYPFYIGYATVQLKLSSQVAVPVLLAMQTAGSIGGALVYTWLGARNNLLYMRLALCAAAILPICALLAAFFGPVPLYIGFLVSGLATSSILLSSYLNWMVGYADPNKRPLYIGLSNTLSAVIAIVAPFIAGSIAQTVGYPPLFAVALGMTICALFVVSRYLTRPPLPNTRTISPNNNSESG